MIEQQKLARALCRNLPTQLTADAATRPGYQHHFPRQVAGQQIGVGWHRIATQQVFNLQFLEILHRHAPTGQVGPIRQSADVHRHGTQALDDLLAARARCAGQSQQQIRHPLFDHQPRHAGRGKDRDPVDAAPDLGRVIIDKANQYRLRAYPHGGSRLHTGGACSIDEEPALVTAIQRTQARQPKPGKCAAGAHHQKKYQGLQNTQTAGYTNPLTAPLHRHQQCQQQHAIDGRRLGRGHQRGLSGVAKYGPVQAKSNKNRNKHQR